MGEGEARVGLEVTVAVVLKVEVLVGVVVGVPVEEMETEAVILGVPE